MDEQGLLLCARYSIPPNFFGYCGPQENSNLIDHLKEHIGDREVASILSEFETLYHYLVFIAKENRIEDPFDRRVVEAYWIGNMLLGSVSRADYIALLKERFLMEKRIGLRKTQQIGYKVFHRAFFPHHSFHVFNIFKRTGHDPSAHTLQTMDECRIGFGKIKSQNPKTKKVIVESRKLNILNKKLYLEVPRLKELRLDYKGKSFLNNLRDGEWVSFHWGFVCDRLTESQVRNLAYYTQKAIDFFNAT